MKKRGILVLLSLVTCGLLWTPGNAQAAACSNVSSYGAVNLTVPELPNDDSRLLWVRLQATGSDAVLLAEINKDQCLEIKAQDVEPNQWVWIARQEGNVSAPISFPARQGNTLRLIGITDGLKVDRVLLTEESCVPADFGNNCKDAVALGQELPENVTVLAAPSDGVVSGKVTLSPTPGRYQDQLVRVEYIVAGKTIQSAGTPEAFDTSLIKNGTHTVLIDTKLTDGSIIHESVVVEVRNAENIFTPVVRWMRLNTSLLRLAGIIIGGAALLFVIIMVLRGWWKHNRERVFHGF